MTLQLFLPALMAGFLTQSSLIVAVGAQNAYVLRQGVARVHVPMVVTTCVVSDVVLIGCGALGMGAAIVAAPGIVVGMKWIGAAFLAGYGVLAASRIWRGGDEGISNGQSQPGRRKVFLSVLGFTWLNPHVYLDTVVLLGAIGATFGSRQTAFTLGEMSCSLIWFALLGFGARLLRPMLQSRMAWRVLDGLIAATMFAVAAGLVVSTGN